MDRLVDHLLVFEGEGVVRDFPGNYTLYRLQEEKKKLTEYGSQMTMKTALKENTIPEKKKVSFKDKRELELLQKEIEELTHEKETITMQLNEGSLPYEELQKLAERIGEVTSLLDEKKCAGWN